MILISQTLRAVACAVALLAACQVQAASSNSATLSLSGLGGGGPVAPGALSDIVIDVSGIASVGRRDDIGNTFLTFDIGANSAVTGISWNVNVTAFNPSWLSEITVAFGTSTVGAARLELSPGQGDDVFGTMSYSSGGVIDLIGLGLNFNVNADGLLVVEFLERNDDVDLSPDGLWNSGALTIQVAAIPEPATYGLMALGLLAVGAAARRRQS
jgi:hypothetical protein